MTQAPEADRWLLPANVAFGQVSELLDGRPVRGPLDGRPACGPLDSRPARGPLDSRPACEPLDSRPAREPLDSRPACEPLDGRPVREPLDGRQARETTAGRPACGPLDSRQVCEILGRVAAEVLAEVRAGTWRPPATLRVCPKPGRQPAASDLDAASYRMYDRRLV